MYDGDALCCALTCFAFKAHDTALKLDADWQKFVHKNGNSMRG
jgi:hypothetical protein